MNCFSTFYQIKIIKTLDLRYYFCQNEFSVNLLLNLRDRTLIKLAERKTNFRCFLKYFNNYWVGYTNINNSTSKLLNDKLLN